MTSLSKLPDKLLHANFYSEPSFHVIRFTSVSQSHRPEQSEDFQRQIGKRWEWRPALGSQCWWWWIRGKAWGSEQWAEQWARQHDWTPRGRPRMGPRRGRGVVVKTQIGDTSNPMRTSAFHQLTWPWKHLGDGSFVHCWEPRFIYHFKMTNDLSLAPYNPYLLERWHLL